MRETGYGHRLEKVRPLWQLLMGFTRIGLLSFGGGTGIAALLEHELVHRWRSFTAKEFTELFALGRAIPGVIGANLAFVYGWVLAGFPGALAGVIGICLLPLCLSLPLMKWLFEMGGSIPYIQSCFTVLRPVVVGIIVATIWRIGRASVDNRWSLALAVLLAVAGLSGYVGVLGLVLIAAGAGLGRGLWELRAGRAEE